MEPKSNALRQDRQLCNKSCGILLLYWLLMNGIVISVLLIRLGLALLTSGASIFTLPDQIEMLLTSELLMDGTGYILASLAGLVMVFLWKGDSLFRESFRYRRSMTGRSAAAAAVRVHGLPAVRQPAQYADRAAAALLWPDSVGGHGGGQHDGVQPHHAAVCLPAGPHQ